MEPKPKLGGAGLVVSFVVLVPNPKKERKGNFSILIVFFVFLGLRE